MNRYTINLTSDENDIGIQSLSVNVDAGTYGAIRDFLLGKIQLSIIQPEPVIPSDSSE